MGFHGISMGFQGFLRTLQTCVHSRLYTSLRLADLCTLASVHKSDKCRLVYKLFSAPNLEKEISVYPG